MRTDSIALSDEFVQSVRQYLQGNDPDNLPGKAKKHRARANAQESHERSVLPVLTIHQIR